MLAEYTLTACVFAVSWILVILGDGIVWLDASLLGDKLLPSDVSRWQSDRPSLAGRKFAETFVDYRFEEHGAIQLNSLSVTYGLDSAAPCFFAAELFHRLNQSEILYTWDCSIPGLDLKDAPCRVEANVRRFRCDAGYGSALSWLLGVLSCTGPIERDKHCPPFFGGREFFNWCRSYVQPYVDKSFAPHFFYSGPSGLRGPEKVILCNALYHDVGRYLRKMAFEQCTEEDVLFELVHLPLSSLETLSNSVVFS